MVTIREIREDDAAGFLAMLTQLDQESRFMLLEPGERQTTADQQCERIRQTLGQPNSIVLVAECDGRIIGHVAALGEPYCRSRHTAHVVIGILRAFSGLGLGTRLLETLEQWAKEHGIHRLELTVMTHNERAIWLYSKMGYQIEGVQKDSLRVDGQYVDEYRMAKVL
jgi:RimJ/RimL family protein N-acetyltransferase